MALFGINSRNLAKTLDKYLPFTSPKATDKTLYYFNTPNDEGKTNKRTANSYLNRMLEDKNINVKDEGTAKKELLNKIGSDHIQKLNEKMLAFRNDITKKNPGLDQHAISRAVLKALCKDKDTSGTMKTLGLHEVGKYSWNSNKIATEKLNAISQLAGSEDEVKEPKESLKHNAEDNYTGHHNSKYNSKSMINPIFFQSEILPERKEDSPQQPPSDILNNEDSSSVILSFVSKKDNFNDSEIKEPIDESKNNIIEEPHQEETEQQSSEILSKKNSSFIAPPRDEPKEEESTKLNNNIEVNTSPAPTAEQTAAKEIINYVVPAAVDNGAKKKFEDKDLAQMLIRLANLCHLFDNQNVNIEKKLPAEIVSNVTKIQKNPDTAQITKRAIIIQFGSEIQQFCEKNKAQIKDCDKSLQNNLKLVLTHLKNIAENIQHSPKADFNSITPSSNGIYNSIKQTANNQKGEAYLNNKKYLEQLL